MGDILRGKQPINQLVPNHPYIDDISELNHYFENNKQHFMLLTLTEAKGILSDLLGKADDFFSYKLGGGNLKDIWDGAHTFVNFSTYINESNAIAYNLKVFGIKAIPFIVNGVAYIKITGYPSLRRILKGTRYRANNLQLLELGIGWRGLISGIAKGAKFCVYFSLGFRAIELMFKNEYTLIDFFGDVVMDAAKTIVASVVAVAVGSMITLTIPFIIIDAVFIIAIGIGLNMGLNFLDYHYGWSITFKEELRRALIEQNKMQKWHRNNMSPEIYFIYNLHN